MQFRTVDQQPWSRDPVCMLIYQYVWRNAMFRSLDTDYRGNPVALNPGDYATTMLELGDKAAVSGMYRASKNPDSAVKSAVRRALDTLTVHNAVRYRIIGSGRTTAIVISMIGYVESLAFSESQRVAQLESQRESKTNAQLESQCESETDAHPKSLNTQERRGVAGDSESQLESQRETEANAQLESQCETEDNAQLESQRTSLKKQGLSSNNDDQEECKSVDLRCPHLEILGFWQDVLPGKPQPNRNLWTSKRAGYQALSQRWKEGFKIRRSTGGTLYHDRASGLAWWRQFFEYAAESKFLVNQHKGFTLEWLAKSANFVKVLEGQYHDHG